MARQIDKNKLKAIKKATIEVVVSEGISGASISKIAEKADVSVGYLYRFYKGKRELLEILFEERFKMIHSLLQEQVNTQNTVKDIITVFVNTVYDVAKKEPQTISFSYKLLSDFSFELSKEFKNNVAYTCSEVIKIGNRTGEIDEKINKETLYAVIVGGMFNLINIRQREIFEKENFSNEDSQNTVQLLLKTLAPNNKKNCS